MKTFTYKKEPVEDLGEMCTALEAAIAIKVANMGDDNPTYTNGFAIQDANGTRVIIFETDGEVLQDPPAIATTDIDIEEHLDTFFLAREYEKMV